MIKKITIPIFPLNGVIFFPNTDLPLNIFEEKYLEMVDFALTQNKIIGMIQLKKNGDLYSKGCLGKITSYNETEDRRYLINIKGENIFSIVKEIKSGYQFKIAEVNIRYEHINENDSENINTDLLLNKFYYLIKRKNISIDFNLLKNIETSVLIKFIAMSGPFSPLEKQMLLETISLKQLYDKLILLFEFYSNQNKENNLIN